MDDIWSCRSYFVWFVKIAVLFFVCFLVINTVKCCFRPLHFLRRATSQEPLPGTFWLPSLSSCGPSAHATTCVSLVTVSMSIDPFPMEINDPPEPDCFGVAKFLFLKECRLTRHSQYTVQCHLVPHPPTSGGCSSALDALMLDTH